MKTALYQAHLNQSAKIGAERQDMIFFKVNTRFLHVNQRRDLNQTTKVSL